MITAESFLSPTTRNRPPGNEVTSEASGMPVFIVPASSKRAAAVSGAERRGVVRFQPETLVGMSPI